MSNIQPQNTPSYREQINKQLREMKVSEESRFSPAQFPTFSPFQVTATKDLHTDSKRKDGKGMFDSVSKLVTISPKANPKVEINVVMFERDFEKIRSIISLFPPRPYISAEKDISVKPAEIIYSYHSSPT